MQALFDVVNHQPFVAHFNLPASLFHQLQRKLHRQVQFSQINQAAQVAFDFTIGFVVVAEIAVDIALVEIGRVRDRMARRRRQLWCRSLQIESRGEPAEGNTILFRQLY